MGSADLDAVDEGILARLEGDARNVTTAAIAEDLGVAGSTVATRISRLEEAGVIAGYSPAIDYDEIGCDHRLLVRGTLTDEGGALEDVRAVEGVIGAKKLVTDAENLVVDLVGRSRDEIEARADELGEVGVEVVATEVVERETRRPTGIFSRQDEPEA